MDTPTGFPNWLQWLFTITPGGIISVTFKGICSTGQIGNVISHVIGDNTVIELTTAVCLLTCVMSDGRDGWDVNQSYYCWYSGYSSGFG